MHHDLRRCRDGLRTALADLSAADAETSPGGRWSIAAILDHLDLSYTLNAFGLERRLQKGSPSTPKPVTGRHRLGRWAILWFGYFPPGQRSPDAVLPRGRRFGELTVVIEPHLLVLDQRLKDAARAWGSRRPILNHPILGPFSVADWRRFHWVHTRHHLERIREVRSQVRTSNFEVRS